MKIMFEANFDFGDRFNKVELELDCSEVTLKSLLEMISDKYYGGVVRFIDPETGSVDSSEYNVRVNSVNCDLLPGGTSLKLKDGDRVRISMLMDILGGG